MPIKTSHPANLLAGQVCYYNNRVFSLIYPKVWRVKAYLVTTWTNGESYSLTNVKYI